MLGTKDCLRIEETVAVYRHMVFIKVNEKPCNRMRSLILVGHVN